MQKNLSVLEVFSPILIQEYVRLMTAAHYIKSENTSSGLKFKISAENYQKIKECPTLAPWINLNIDYDDKQEILSVSGNEAFIKTYENKIQQEVALKFEENYQNRYSKYIQLITD